VLEGCQNGTILSHALMVPFCHHSIMLFLYHYGTKMASAILICHFCPIVFSIMVHSRLAPKWFDFGSTPVLRCIHHFEVEFLDLPISTEDRELRDRDTAEPAHFDSPSYPPLCIFLSIETKEHHHQHTEHLVCTSTHTASVTNTVIL
jgi:hypothetical protein